jgi:hypothetical protein
VKRIWISLHCLLLLTQSIYENTTVIYSYETFFIKGFKVGDRVSGLWGNPLPGSGGMVEYALANPEKDIVVKISDNR